MEHHGVWSCTSIYCAYYVSRLSCYVDSYVDSQLRNSRRFDAAGIKLDHPGLFEPFPRRRSSSSTSTSSTSSAASNHKEDLDDGQLRYWTSDMCRHSPHLFDFVVTVHSLSHIVTLSVTNQIRQAWRRWDSLVYFLALPAYCSAGAAVRTRLSWFPDQL
jgi:hypothetical protein